jgi:uncharacterized protein (TIGR03435 family)
MRTTLPLILLALAQTVPQFEVATIKITDPASPLGNATNFTKTRFQATGSVQDLLRVAYGVQDFQISGGPKWLYADRFDIEAKPEHPSGQGEIKLMLRTLLADRFKLALHRETREMPVYALVLDKKGPKLRAVTDGVGSMSAGRGRITGRLTMADLAHYLAPVLGRTVLDRTGLTGGFEFKMEWATDDDPAGPSIFTAVREQLGLRLESTRGPVEVLAIEGAEKPSGN